MFSKFSQFTINQRFIILLALAAPLIFPGDPSIIGQYPLSRPPSLEHLLGTTAKLEFRLVGQPGADPADVEEMEQTEGGRISVEKQVMVQGEDLTDAQPGFDQRTSEPIVSFRFNTNGARRFAQATQENVGRPFAIVLDNEVISAPVIREPIIGGSGQISGNFTVQAANDLAILLHAGADRVVVILGLDDRERDAGLVVKDVVGALVLAARHQLMTINDGALADAHFLVNLRGHVLSATHQAGRDELGADVAFAEGFLVHPARCW